MKQKKSKTPKKLTRAEMTNILGGIDENIEKLIVLGPVSEINPPGSNLCGCRSSVCIA